MKDFSYNFTEDEKGAYIQGSRDAIISFLVGFSIGFSITLGIFLVITTYIS